MGQYQSNRIEKKGTHFTWEERLIWQRLLYKSKIKSPQKLGDILGKSNRTIRREIKRGWETFTASDLTLYQAYSPDVSQRKADENLSAKGPDLKLGNDYILVESIAHIIKIERYSPDAVIMNNEKNGWPSETIISVRTLYRYIDEGLIPNVSSDDLLHRGMRVKKSPGRPRRHSRAASAQKSITMRPLEVESRDELGHWELDCAVSGKGKGKEALMTLTERKTRQEIIRKIKDQSSSSIVAEMDKLERYYGSLRFRNLFKTITCDNGSEFMDLQGMERSILTKRKRTDIYYAHPYCASERGSNENANGIIRRFIPKGSAIGHYSKERIREIHEWMNLYPRKILGGMSANEAFHTAMGV
jgi:IS30 family transposase